MWFLQRASHIKGFLSTKKQKYRTGHVWLRNQELQKVLSQLKPISKQIKKSFYKQFKSAIKTKNTTQALSLISQGQSEVPKFEVIWSKLKDSIQANSFDHPSFKKALKSLLYPYYFLNLNIQKQAKYKATSDIALAKIFLIYGGYKNTTESILNIIFSDEINLLNIKGHTLKYEFSGDFNYKLNSYGKLIQYKSVANINSAYLKNLSTIYARPNHSNFEEFNGIKKIYMTKSKFFKKDNLELQMEFEFDSIQSIDDLPLLKLNFLLKEKPEDKKDALRVYGKGYTLLFPWGIVKDFKTTVKFRFKALGFDLFKGRVTEKIEYIQ
ncbi:MAG: hypothetical protein COB02_17890 [Candidatus Cloacimonadota bacterium]|nr:MAG: hypothetical protein COB02_17890 [Candidatus Cloacimonadota bacterium]